MRDTVRAGEGESETNSKGHREREGVQRLKVVTEVGTHRGVPKPECGEKQEIRKRKKEQN